MLSFTALVASAEALSLGVKAGLDPATMLEVINASSGRNTATEVKIPNFVLSRGFDFGIAVELSAKDARLCVDEGARLDLPMRVGRPMAEFLSETVERYGGQADLTYAARLLEEITGVEIASPGTLQPRD